MLINIIADHEYSIVEMIHLNFYSSFIAQQITTGLNRSIDVQIELVTAPVITNWYNIIPFSANWTVSGCN